MGGRAIHAVPPTPDLVILQHVRDKLKMRHAQLGIDGHRTIICRKRNGRDCYYL